MFQPFNQRGTGSSRKVPVSSGTVERFELTHGIDSNPELFLYDLNDWNGPRHKVEC
jgi:hypothetical protein